MRGIYSATLTIPSLLFIVFLVQLLVRKKKKEKTRYRLPPGRRGWPLIGDSFSWYNAVAGSHPPQFVQQQVNRFGKIFSCSLFGKWAVVSADPTFNRFIMQNEGKLFQSSYPKSFRDLVGKNGVITVQGEQQRKLHGIASNMMRLEKLKFHFLDDIQLAMLQTLNKFDSNQVILLQDVAINLMVNQLLGASTETEIKEMAHLFSDFVDGCLSLPVNLPGFAYHTAMKARERIIRKINKTIEKRRREGSSEGGNGVLGRLLEEENLPDNEVADFIINLLFAGSETTAKTMLFAVYFLTQCPVAMQQLQDEQDSLRGDCNGVGMLAWQDYKAMSFTMCVIDEALRLGGIAIWFMRQAKEEVVYQDYVIPKGSFVVPFLSAVHLDENLYKEATTFIHGDGWTLQIKYFFCARFCPGAELSRLQIALFLHYFVTTYTWSQLKEDRMSFFPSARLVNGFQIRLTKRRHVTDSTLPSQN
ncbi:cytochrome P450 family protein [Salix suchowensis]|nr:cytochrome P450 family protein [Salix suchowensis]